MALIARPRSRAARRLCAAIAWLVLTPTAWGMCLPLPSPEMQALDRLAEGDPERGIAEAETRLRSSPPGRDLLAEVELYAIIAEARAEEGRADEAHAAVVAGLGRLARLPASSATDRLRQRLAMSDVMNAETKADLEAAVDAMDGFLTRYPRDSIERSCALSARAESRAELLELDLAAADGIAAYRMAESGGWTMPRIRATVGLATIYRRSGLYAEAERMIDEFVAYARSANQPSQLASAMYLRGQVLIDERKYHDARAALEAARSAAEKLGDRLGAAFSNVALCPALIAEPDLDAAERVCSASDPELSAAKRSDLLTLMLSYRARIDLARGRPAAALAKLNEVLGPRRSDILAMFEPQVYQDRGRALGAVGRHREAYRDLAHALELQQTADVAQRARAAAVLKAAADAEQLVATNRALEERMATQRQELAERALAQRLSIALAVVAVLASALFAYLLRLTRRHARAVRRQEIVVRTASSHAPDALVLLDEQRRVRFANRSLFGTGPTPPEGLPLSAAVPAQAWPALEAALDDVVANRRSLSFTTSLADASGAVRHFEMRTAPAVGDGQLIGVTLRSIDVTERRRLEREVIDVASRERQRLSGDLHEGLGQELTGIALLARGLERAIERGQPDALELVAEVVKHINRTIDMTREIARGLSPVQIERGSLSAALERLSIEASRRLRIEITTASDPADVQVSDVAADHLYRIVYEAITNAARHSGGTHVRIELRVEAGTLEVAISDDGTGIRPRTAGNDGFGLKMMAYRARLLGGTFRIEPGLHAGTRIVVAMPMTQATPPAAASDASARTDLDQQ
jgi:two-component system, NarL family, sensor histidine kinase UhpB